MSEERTVSGPDVVVWVSRVGASTAAPLLVGCELDDGINEETFSIVAFDAAVSAVTLEDGRRVRLASFKDCVVLDRRADHPLVAAVEASRTPEDLRDRAELARAGIRADRLGSTEARGAVLAALRAEEDGALPDYGGRHAFYLAMSAAGDAGLMRVAEPVFDRLAWRFAAAGREVPGDLYWRRAALLRSLGRWQEAVAVSEVLHQGVVKGSVDRMLLATTRAAALLDLYEATGAVRWLSLAERACGVAKAIAPGDEIVRDVWIRLSRLRAAAAGGGE